MVKTTRPKSKAEKLADRRKHILDDEKPDPLLEEFLDKGGNDSPSSDDEVPEEVSTKKEDQNERVLFSETKKKRKKRRIKKEAPGVFCVETDDIKLKVVAESSRTVSQILHPTIHFKDLLLAETSKTGRRKAGTLNKHANKWLKPQRTTR